MQISQTWIEQVLTWHITHSYRNDIGVIYVNDDSAPKTLVIKREFEYGN